MRPYWTVLRDAFHEALVSRVLWVLLALITLVLVCLAPLGYRLDLVTEFSVGDFRDARQFVRVLREAAGQQEPSPARYIWTELGGAVQQELIPFSDEAEKRGSDYFRGARRLVEELNKQIARRDFYSPTDWQGITLRREARELVERDSQSLSTQAVARRNRLLIEAAFRREFEARPREAILITFAGFDMTPPLPLTKSQMDKLIEQVALALLMNILLGWIALIAGILVTAPIIPQMFQPGSLHLLLSKPISRSLLYVTRVIGGCAFVLVCVTYLIVGLWVIAGTRFGLWNSGMLKCIPVFLFLFALYYVVSAFVGAIWKNAVVAVVLTIGFSFLCNFLSSSKAIVEGVVIQPQRIVHLVPSGDTLIAVDERGVTKQWNEAARDWEEVFFTQGPLAGMVRLVGPIYDAKEDRLLAVRMRNTGFGGFLTTGSSLQVGDRDRGWQRTDGVRLPRGVFELLQRPEGDVLAIGEEGVSRLRRGAGGESGEFNLFGIKLPLGGGAPDFQSVGPPDWTIRRPAAAALNANTGQLAVYQEGTLTLLRPTDDGQFEIVVTVDLPVDKTLGAGLAFGGSTLLVALPDGRLMVLEADSLQTRATLTPVRKTQPRFANVSPDGRWFSIVYQDGQLWMVDARSDRVHRPRVDGQGDVSAAVFTPDAGLLVAARGTRVTAYDSNTLARREAYQPVMSRIEWLYRYLLIPVYTVFPKPAELNGTIQYLLTNETTTDFAGMASGDLQTKREQLHPWAPIWSGAVFIALMLILACVYIERQEF